jgi:hypothetical protein
MDYMNVGSGLVAYRNSIATKTVRSEREARRSQVFAKRISVREHSPPQVSEPY